MPRGGVTGNRARTGKGKLTDEQVRYIRAKLEIYEKAVEECSPTAIARDMNLSVHTVRDIKQDRIYTHVI
jgi:DNA invertase Pin-like site-specific DNA recombinase